VPFINVLTYLCTLHTAIIRPYETLDSKWSVNESMGHRGSIASTMNYSSTDDNVL